MDAHPLAVHRGAQVDYRLEFIDSRWPGADGEKGVERMHGGLDLAEQHVDRSAHATRPKPHLCGPTIELDGPHTDFVVDEIWDRAVTSEMPSIVCGRDAAARMEGSVPAKDICSSHGMATMSNGAPIVDQRGGVVGLDRVPGGEETYSPEM